MPKKPTDNPEFDAFWSLYPRCLDKPGTKRAYDRAIKRGHTHAEIMTGLREYRFADQPHLIPHSMTWLNGSRFVAEIIRVPPTVVIEQPKPSRASWRDEYERGGRIQSDQRPFIDYVEPYGGPEESGRYVLLTTNQARGK